MIMGNNQFIKDVRQGKMAERYLYQYFFIKQNPNAVFDENEYPSEDQFAGVDIFVPLANGQKAYHDIKAQMDYINAPRKTFVIELSYLKDGVEKVGWGLRSDLKTNFYTIALIHKAKLYKGQLQSFEDIECVEIIMVHKSKIASYLRNFEIELGQNLYDFSNEFRNGVATHKFYNDRLVHCSKGKNEKPVCLVVKLKDWLNMMPANKNLHYLVTKKHIIEIPRNVDVSTSMVESAIQLGHL